MPICSAWNGKINLALGVKKRRFQDDADEASRFFNGPHEFIYGAKYATGSKGFQLSNEEDLPEPTFKMTVNRVAEMVQLFGPVLYHRNPVRQVNPRKPPMPPVEMFGDPNNPVTQMLYLQTKMVVDQERAQDKARAQILEFYLNYTPNELGLKDECRCAIDEAIIKGMGVLWTELYYPKGSKIKMVGSFYDTVDNLVVDPDLETIRDAQWIARKCIHPLWMVEQEYGLKPGSLRGNMESYNSQGTSQVDDDADYERRRGLSNDLLMYYKVWSRMGIGARLSGQGASQNFLEQLRPTLDQLGDYCYLVIVPECPFPLNLPPELVNAHGADQEILRRLEWPTPFWADDEWPCTPIIFHEVPRSIWPMSHLKPALGEMKFLNWAYSFLAAKIRTTSRDFIAVQKSAAEELKTAIQAGTDLSMVEITGDDGPISEIVQFLQHPQFNGDIWKVIQAIEQNFEKRVGLTELIYGMSGKQMRSATEAETKQQQIQVRPDDMAQKVEEAMTQVARKEAIAARWHLDPQDVAPMMGPVGAQMWANLVMGADMFEVVHQLDYRIEAGSTRKPNKERDAQNMQQALQILFAPLMQFAMQTGNFNPVNALIADWAKTIDLDPEKYLFQPPPMPMPMMGGPPVAGGPAAPAPAPPPGPGPASPGPKTNPGANGAPRHATAH